jgi:hypothetical protein
MVESELVELRRAHQRLLEGMELGLVPPVLSLGDEFMRVATARDVVSLGRQLDLDVDTSAVRALLGVPHTMADLLLCSSLPRVPEIRGETARGRLSRARWFRPLSGGAEGLGIPAS